MALSRLLSCRFSPLSGPSFSHLATEHINGNTGPTIRPKPRPFYKPRPDRPGPSSLQDYFSGLHDRKSANKEQALAAGLVVPLPMKRLKPIHNETSASAVATLVTTVKNCIENGLPSCAVPYSATTHGILRVLLKEGMIRGFKYSHDSMGFDVYLKYLAAPTNGCASAEAAIHGAQILSRPTMPFFLNCKAVRLMSKQYFPSIFMIRTSFGILTQFECLRRGIGGEVLCRFM